LPPWRNGPGYVGEAMLLSRSASYRTAPACIEPGAETSLGATRRTEVRRCTLKRAPHSSLWNVQSLGAAGMSAECHLVLEILRSAWWSGPVACKVHAATDGGIRRPAPQESQTDCFRCCSRSSSASLRHGLAIRRRPRLPSHAFRPPAPRQH
jgi:hypothetical protein